MYSKSWKYFIKRCTTKGLVTWECRLHGLMICTSTLRATGYLGLNTRLVARNWPTCFKFSWQISLSIPLVIRPQRDTLRPRYMCVAQYLVQTKVQTSIPGGLPTQKFTLFSSVLLLVANTHGKTPTSHTVYYIHTNTWWHSYVHVYPTTSFLLSFLFYPLLLCHTSMACSHRLPLLQQQWQVIIAPLQPHPTATHALSKYINQHWPLY